jgi:hypothetical protein
MDGQKNIKFKIGHVLAHNVEQQRYSWRGFAFIQPSKNKAKIREILTREISTKCVEHHELQGNKST